MPNILMEISLDVKADAAKGVGTSELVGWAEGMGRTGSLHRG